MTSTAAMKRKSERERIATLFEAMAERVGASCKRNGYKIDGPREISLHLSKDGATVMVDLASFTNAFLGHWFFDDRRGRLFAPGFDGHGYKPHHKATMMTETAEDLCSRIEGAFLRIADGSTAFVAEPLKA